jgi:hypothetical protein
MTTPRNAADAAALAAFLSRGGAVKRLAPAGEAEAKDAARQQYRALRGEPEVTVERESSESRSEQMAEHFAGCAAAGVSSEAALADWNYINATRTASGRNRMKRQIQRDVSREMDEERGY